MTQGIPTLLEANKTFCIDDKCENYILRELKQWILIIFVVHLNGFNVNNDWF